MKPWPFPTSAKPTVLTLSTLMAQSAKRKAARETGRNLLRASTDSQTTANQRRDLGTVAKRSGWKIVKVFEDAAISGAKSSDKRPGLEALLKGVAAKEFDMVAAWSVDRLGRSLTDLLVHIGRQGHVPDGWRLY